MHPYARINDEEEARQEAKSGGPHRFQLAPGPIQSESQMREPVKGLDRQEAPRVGEFERAGRSTAHLALFRSGNPYATHHYFPPDDLLVSDDATSKAALDSDAIGIPKGAFRQICYSIFRSYMPNLERGKLRSHHRDFVARNESQPAAIRRKIVDALQKYSLASIPGLLPHFNREDDVFTESKLKKIEESVLRPNVG